MNYLYYSLTISFILIGSGCNPKINNEKTQKETKVLNENESFDANKVIMTCIPELIESEVDSISIQIVNNTQDVITFGDVYRIMVLKDYRWEDMPSNKTAIFNCIGYELFPGGTSKKKIYLYPEQNRLMKNRIYKIDKIIGFDDKDSIFSAFFHVQ